MTDKYDGVLTCTYSVLTRTYSVLTCAGMPQTTVHNLETYLSVVYLLVLLCFVTTMYCNYGAFFLTGTVQHSMTTIKAPTRNDSFAMEKIATLQVQNLLPAANAQFAEHY